VLDRGCYSAGLGGIPHTMLGKGITMTVSQNHHRGVLGKTDADEVAMFSIERQQNRRAPLLLIIVGTGGFLNQAMLNQASAEQCESRAAPFSSNASMIAVRDVEAPGIAGRRPFFSVTRSDDWSLLSRADAGPDLRMLETL
jgi:hypothetical protein